MMSGSTGTPYGLTAAIGASDGSALSLSDQNLLFNQAMPLSSIEGRFGFGRKTGAALQDVQAPQSSYMSPASTS